MLQKGEISTYMAKDKVKWICTLAVQIHTGSGYKFFNRYPVLSRSKVSEECTDFKNILFPNGMTRYICFWVLLKKYIFDFTLHTLEYKD